MLNVKAGKAGYFPSSHLQIHGSGRTGLGPYQPARAAAVFLAMTSPLGHSKVKPLCRAEEHERAAFNGLHTISPKGNAYPKFAQAASPWRIRRKPSTFRRQEGQHLKCRSRMSSISGLNLLLNSS
jgi:hypothetical protein